MSSIDLAAIRAAHERIRPHIHRTPVIHSTLLDDASGARLWFKAEMFQKVAAFKARGACNAVLSLNETEAAHGVVTHSSGNHGQALAWAARSRGIAAHIVMPSNAARPKVRGVEGYGGRVVFCEPTQAGREAACARIVEETGATLIHPFNDFRVMAGQGTAAIELLEDVPDLDLILCPVGGGGLAAGTAIAAKSLRPGIRVVGVEPAGADDAARSFAAGRIVAVDKPASIADGLRSTVGVTSFPILKQWVDGIVTVPDEAIVSAMRRLMEVLKVVVEPSGAVPWAAVLERKLDVKGLRVGIILTGGNVDLDALPWLKS